MTDIGRGQMAGASRPLIGSSAVPGHTLADFRDPYVFAGPGGLHMLVASRTDLGGAVLHFRTADPSGVGDWRFSSVLHIDARNGITVAECPCMVPLDGPAESAATLWVLIYAQLNATDPATGRRNTTNAVVGRFDGTRLTPVLEQDLDFGTGAYAFQALADDDGPVAIARMANWIDFDRVSPSPRP